MMPQIAQVGVHAPQLIGGSADWINTNGRALKLERDTCYLVDFWDYTCVNCLRTLPYLKEWYRRYHDMGLQIIGIHTPEFEFAKDRRNVEEAVQELGIEYPVLMDNEQRNWDAFANHYWPREFLIDPDGMIRYDHIGEGAYGDTELAIQDLVHSMHPDAQLPTISEPLTASEMPGAVCHQPTPELYAGYMRGRVANSEGLMPGKVVDYQGPEEHAEDMIFLQGAWESRPESIRHARATEDLEDFIGLRYRAIEVNAVIRPDKPGSLRAYVFQDGAPLRPEDKGVDVFYDDDHNAYLLIDEPRMYRIVDNQEYGAHELELRTDSDSLELFAFTFGACEVPRKQG